jgi:hypothetical protein
MSDREPITAHVIGGIGPCKRYKDGVMRVERIPGCGPISKEESMNNPDDDWDDYDDNWDDDEFDWDER